MLFNKKPRWLRVDGIIINLDRVSFFARGTADKNDTGVVFNDTKEPIRLRNTTLDDIHYFLKHGRPRKRKA